MRIKNLLPALLLVGVAGCTDFLQVKPINDQTDAQAITSAAGARAALAGIYDATQSTSYYGGNFLFFSDLPADDVLHTGTFTTFADAEQNQILADNTTIEAIWNALYRTIGRVNIVLDRVPNVPDLSATERDQILGEAHFIRALTLHNLVKLWGDSAATALGVPVVTTPPASIAEASQVTRATTAEVYTQIVNDLQTAENLMSTEKAGTRASRGAVRAIRSRVHLYRENWAEAEAAAEAVLAMSPGYSLAPEYSALFTATGTPTTEDIFRVAFTAVEFNNLGWYYRSRTRGGRWEIAPSPTLIAAYAAAGDVVRRTWNIEADAAGRIYGSKYPTGNGAEHPHVIRLAEVLLIKAEAEARQGGAKLTEALESLNLVRARAGLPDLVLGVDVLDEQDVIDAIILERRLELAMEGDRWPDLGRRGAVVSTLGIADRPHQRLFPIPQQEMDVAHNLVQNPGY